MAQIIVIDLGSQLSHLIARRVRELNVYSEVYPNTLTVEDIQQMKGLKGIILSGGPASVYSEHSLKVDTRIFDLDIPVLGICYGHQLLAKHQGRKVFRLLVHGGRDQKNRKRMKRPPWNIPSSSGPTSL